MVGMDVSLLLVVLFWLTLAAGLIALGWRVARAVGGQREDQEAALARLARLRSPRGIPFFRSRRALLDLSRDLDEIEDYPATRSGS